MDNTKGHNQDEIWDPEFWKIFLRHKQQPSKMPTRYNALPKDTKFAFMTPGYYVKGFRFLNLLTDEIETDLKELKRLLFIEDPKEVHKWGILKERIPYSKGRITKLPGTRTLQYQNYCVRNLTPETASSWRKSIQTCEQENVDEENICPKPQAK